MTDTEPEREYDPSIPPENRFEIVFEASATVTKADGTIREDGDLE